MQLYKLCVHTSTRHTLILETLFVHKQDILYIGGDYMYTFLSIHVHLLFQYSIFFISCSIFIAYFLETCILFYYRKYEKTRDFTKSLSLHKNDISSQNKNSPPQELYILLPVLNEEEVIESTLRALIKNKRRDLHFIVIDDDSSDKTVEMVRLVQRDDPRITLLLRKKPNAQKGKGASLNAALSYVQHIKKQADHHNIIGVIDADSFVGPSFFDTVHTLFEHTQINGIQSKVRVLKTPQTSIDLTYIQDLEFSEIINALQLFRSRLDHAAFGGNGQFTRLSVLNQLGNTPWSTSLVEDYDISLRLALQNIHHFYHIPNLEVFQSGIQNITQLINQRTRWSQGNIECLKYTPTILTSKMKFPLKLEILYFIYKPWIILLNIFILFYTLFIIFFKDIHHLFPNHSLVLSIYLITWSSLFIFNMLWSICYTNHTLRDSHSSIFKRSFYRFIHSILLTFFMFLMNFAFLKALYRHFQRKKTWVKTEHKKQ